MSGERRRSEPGHARLLNPGKRLLPHNLLQRQRKVVAELSIARIARMNSVRARNQARHREGSTDN